MRYRDERSGGGGDVGPEVVRAAPGKRARTESLSGGSIPSSVGSDVARIEASTTPPPRSDVSFVDDLLAGTPVQRLAVGVAEVANDERAGDVSPSFVDEIIQAGPSGRSDGASDPAGIKAQGVAARGVAGPSASLPHLDAIQSSFGRHDVTAVAAHVGGEAATASKALGAEAYATGSHVAFAQSPSLHVAAHEAAHIVQQRGGVQLKGGVGASGDVYEQHAEEVARAVVEGRSAESLLDRAPAGSGGSGGDAIQRFGADEHEFMGNLGSGAALVQLAPDYSLPYGEITALAGDHFSSIEQMRLFAARTDGGAGSRLEIEYARKWKLGKKVEWKDGDPKYDQAKKAQEKRYYVLAGGNEAPYEGNASHFLNPREGDMDRSTADKAVDQDRRMDDRTDGKKLGQWVQMWVGTGAPGNYRLNHVNAIAEAVEAGRTGKGIGEALARDAFASHYLTDVFASGHVRTPRLSAKEYWDAKVPMFYENLTGFMAEKIAAFLIKHGSDVEVMGLYPDADHVPDDDVWKGARDKVRGVFEAKAKLAFGDIVGLALHDYDNDTGVAAHVDGKPIHLIGDGGVLDGGTVTSKGADTAQAAARAVSLSVADIMRAYEIGKGGKGFGDAILELFGRDNLFAAEHLIPTVTKEDRDDPSNPELKWKFDSYEQLITDDRMKKALEIFLREKAGELTGAGFKGDEQKAIEDLATTMLGDPEKLLRAVINWTPNSGGGWTGNSSDANARDYYKKAKSMKGGLQSLTGMQRINLIVDCVNGVVSEEDEETVWGLLSTATDAQAREIIAHIGWDDLAEYLDGVEDTRFRKRFPKDQYK